MENRISIIIPCFNSEQTLGVCLQSIFRSDNKNFQVIVVDDFSTDNTRAIVEQFPCRLICLPQHRGAGYARNVGAQAASGDILFFTDADCVLRENTLQILADTMTVVGKNVMVGGTYSRQSHDKNFFSRFQSLFIHYAETKHLDSPDYIATHALAMHASLFHQHEGFNNREFPILEDVEYSHRLRRRGVKLLMNPQLQVQHIFNFSFLRSMKNAVRKTRYWTTYILNNKNLLTDSGTASTELKFTTLAFAVELMLLLIFLTTAFLPAMLLFCALILTNLAVNYPFLKSIFRTQGTMFSIAASAYYFFVYPAAVVFGSALGISSYLRQRYLAKEYA